MMISMSENEVEPYEERIHDEDDERPVDSRPEVLMARFPASIIVLSLEEQLGKGSTAYSTNDYLSPILDRFKVIEDRIADTTHPIHHQIKLLRQQTYRKITDRIGEDMEMDFDNLHLEIGSADDLERVEEIYRFFCLYRQRNIENIIYEIISINKDEFANCYRHDTVKRNQSLRDARKIFKRYNDVLIYTNYQGIVEDLVNQMNDLDLSLEGCLQMIHDESPVPDEGYLQHIAATYTDLDFLARYLEPLENDQVKTKVIINGKHRWMMECEKKENKA